MKEKVLDSRFSLNMPSGPIQSISYDVRLSVCMYILSPEVWFKLLFAPVYNGPKSIFFGSFNSLRISYRKEVLSHFARVRGTALTSVKEVMTEGVLLSTILPPSTTMPPPPPIE